MSPVPRKSKPPEKAPAANPDGLYLIAGTDEFEVSRRARQLAEELCPEADRAFGLDIIEGACDTIDEAVKAVRLCLDALRTVGFFGSNKLVWLQNASFFYDGKPGKYEDVKKAVKELTEEIKAGIPPGVRLLISAANVDKRTGFYNAMDKGGRVEFFNLPDKGYKMDEHAMGVARRFLEENGLKARPDVINAFVARAGNHSRQLFQEAEKLALYIGKRKDVTVDDVLAIVSPAREHGYGELADAFSKRNLPDALKTCRQLLGQKENPVGLIISLENRVRELLIYRIALDRRLVRITGSGDWPKVEWSNTPEADAFFSGLTNDPRRANAFWGGRLARSASNFKQPELQRIQRILVEEHGRMTDGSAPAEFLLEWALIRTLKANEQPCNTATAHSR